MENEKIEVTIVPSKAFTMRLPLPELYDIPSFVVSMTVNYIADEDMTSAEAWLSSNRRPTMKFLGDTCEFNSAGMTEDEIEDKIIAEFNESELIAQAIEALFVENYDYFVLEYSPTEIERFETCQELFYERFAGIIEYLHTKEQSEKAKAGNYDRFVKAVEKAKEEKEDNNGST